MTVAAISIATMVIVNTLVRVDRSPIRIQRFGWRMRAIQFGTSDPCRRANTAAAAIALPADAALTTATATDVAAAAALPR